MERSSLHWKKRKTKSCGRWNAEKNQRSRLAGTVISRKMVVAVGTGVVKTNEPKILKVTGWMKRKGTTGKV